MSHKQVWVKVNATVDEKVAPIVNLLNQIEDFQTIDSCEGDSEAWGWVFFFYGNWSKMCEFVFSRLAPIKEELGEDVVVLIEVTGEGKPRGEIRFRAEALARLHSSLKRVYGRP